VRRTNLYVKWTKNDIAWTVCRLVRLATALYTVSLSLQCSRRSNCCHSPSGCLLIHRSEDPSFVVKGPVGNDDPLDCEKLIRRCLVNKLLHTPLNKDDASSLFPSLQCSCGCVRVCVCDCIWCSLNFWSYTRQYFVYAGRTSYIYVYSPPPCKNYAKRFWFTTLE